MNFSMTKKKIRDLRKKWRIFLSLLTGRHFLPFLPTLSNFVFVVKEGTVIYERIQQEEYQRELLEMIPQ